ncbi:hypothetical protein HMPREF2527_07670 [Rothia sp. HMSC071B01]|nr:hypothetical protein HMPREF2527_07670 [Rothia sp. HMSC071B01]
MVAGQEAVLQGGGGLAALRGGLQCCWCCWWGGWERKAAVYPGVSEEGAASAGRRGECRVQ